MGCTYDVLNIRLENRDFVEKFKKFFNKILKDYLYDINFDNFIVRDDEKGFCWVSINEEPLFKTAEGIGLMEWFGQELALKYPTKKFYMDYKCTYNNCGDADYLEYDYDGNCKVKVKLMNSDMSGIFECPECEAWFEDALVYIEDYKENERYICPECGAEIKYEVYIREYEENVFEI